MRFVASLPTGSLSPRSVVAVLTAIATSWGEAMRQDQSGAYPPLYSLGVIFTPEKKTEVWQSPPQLIDSRRGDCEDLVIYRFGELFAAGHPVTVECVFREEPWGMRQHVRLRRGTTIEDPSLVVLGKAKPWPVKLRR